MQNSDFWTRITSLYGSQTSPVVLCMQYSVISTRIICLYGPQPLSVVFACKTATFGAKLQVSMGPRPHRWILDAKQRLLNKNNKSPWFSALTYGFWMQNSLFWYRIISLYGSQTSPISLCMQNIVISIRFKSLCGSHTSPVVLCTQNNVPRNWITSLHGFQPSSVVFWCKTAVFGPEQQVSIGTWPHLLFCAWKTAWLAPE